MSNKSGQLIAGLDIGSTTIRLVAGKSTLIEEEGGVATRLNIVGAAEVPAEGVSRGNIVSIEEAVNSILAAVDRVERIVGQPIERVFLSVGGSQIVARDGKGVAAVSRNDNEITEEDVERAVESSRIGVESSNYEILHILPKGFTVDGQAGIKDPVGMNGIRLEVNTEVILGLVSQIKTLTKCVYRSGLDVEDLVFSGIAVSEAVLSSRQKELGVVQIDIGGSTTSMVVYEEGEMIHSAVLPIGSGHITADIAIGLRIGLDAAERIKIEYGRATLKDVNKGEEINLSEVDPIEEGVVSKKYVCEIIEARVEEIFDKVNLELKKINRDGLLPAGAVLVGGGAKLTGIVDLAKRKLRLPVSLGNIQNITSVVDKVQDLSFAVAVGLVKWGHAANSGNDGGSMANLKKMFGLKDTVKKWFKALIP